MNFFNLLGQAALLLEIRKALFGEPTVPQAPIYNSIPDANENECVNIFTIENDVLRINMQNRLKNLIRTRDQYLPCTRRYERLNNEIIVLRNQIKEYDAALGYI